MNHSLQLTVGHMLLGNTLQLHWRHQQPNNAFPQLTACLGSLRCWHTGLYIWQNIHAAHVEYRHIHRGRKEREMTLNVVSENTT